MRVLHPAAAAPTQFAKLVFWYSMAAPMLFASVYWFRLRGLPLLNQFVCLMLLAVLLPYVSYEYTLVHVYLCFGVYLLYLLERTAAGAARLSRGGVIGAMVLFALVIAPLARLTGYHFEGQVKCLLLLGLLAIFLVNPMPSRLFQDATLDRAAWKPESA